jgi:hypothetical protein
MDKLFDYCATKFIAKGLVVHYYTFGEIQCYGMSFQKEYVQDFINADGFQPMDIPSQSKSVFLYIEEQTDAYRIHYCYE